MRTTMHSSRTNAVGRVHGNRHNDRRFNLKDAINIDQNRTPQNWYWNLYDENMTFAEAELQFYNDVFGEQLAKTNENYEKNRHPERKKTMDQFMRIRSNAPEEITIQIGKAEEHVDAQVLCDCFNDYYAWLDNWCKEHGYPFTVLDMALHVDEAVPHIHLRRVWHYIDDDGVWHLGQEKALAAAGMSLPDPNKKEGKYNHRKMTFDAMARQKWLDICETHGLKVTRDALPGGKHNRDKEDLIRDKYADMIDATKKLQTDYYMQKQKLQKLKSESLEKEMQLRDYDATIGRMQRQIVTLADTIKNQQDYKARADKCLGYLDKLRNLLVAEYTSKNPLRNKKTEQAILSAVEIATDYIATSIVVLAAYEDKVQMPERISQKIETGLHVALESLINDAEQTAQNQLKQPKKNKTIDRSK